MIGIWITTVLCASAPNVITTPTKKPVIGVFCSASNGIIDDFKKISFELGERLGLEKYGLVTGGAKGGMMKHVVDGYVSKGENGKIHCVIPTVFTDYETPHPTMKPEDSTWTNTVHLRLATFHEKCDTVVVLPGGFGTLHELMDFLVHNQFGGIKTKIILLNLNDFWSNLVNQFNKMKEVNALRSEHFEMIQVCNNLDECLKTINMVPENMKKDKEQDRYWEVQTNLV